MKALENHPKIDVVIPESIEDIKTDKLKTITLKDSK